MSAAVVSLPVVTAREVKPPRKASYEPAGGDIVPLKAWTPTEKRAALQRLYEACKADPRGKELATALLQAINRI